MIRSPFHPGMFLRNLLNEHRLSQSRLARHIGVQIGVINQICNEKRGISAGMAVKLSPFLTIQKSCASVLRFTASAVRSVASGYVVGPKTPRPSPFAP